MSLKTLLGNTAGKALFISLAGALAIGGVPVKAASAATLADLYRTQMVVRNCQHDFSAYEGDHDGTDNSYEGDGATVAVGRSAAGKLSAAVEAQAAFVEANPSDFDLIFNVLNQEVSTDIEQFCAASIPVAEDVFAEIN